MLQVTGYNGISKGGSPPLIRGAITTWPAKPGTTGLGHGSSMAAYSWNGKHLDRVPYYGYMVNVSCHSLLTLSLRLITFPFGSGVWKEYNLVGQLASISVLRTYGVGQFENHRRDRVNAEIWARITGHVLS